MFSLTKSIRPSLPDRFHTIAEEGPNHGLSMVDHRQAAEESLRATTATSAAVGKPFGTPLHAMNNYGDRVDPATSPLGLNDRNVGALGPRMAELAGRHAELGEQRPGVLLAAVESVRTEPIGRAVFAHANLVHVLEGRVRLETASGSCELLPGSAFALGAGHWCSMRPLPFTRVWTLYLDEGFLRAQMRWILADSTRIPPGVHPDAWDGSAIVLRPGLTVLHRIEPLWRQISVMEQAETTELTTTRLIALFTRTIEFGLPSLLTGPGAREVQFSNRAVFPVRGTLTQSLLTQQVRKAVDLLRGGMAEAWTMDRLTAQVTMSRSHLTRLFNDQVGVPPMRFLTVVRLTEFTRLIEETELPVSSAAREVGWVDARIATRWFSRRFGMTPSEYRGHPHPTVAEGELAQSWRDIVPEPDLSQRSNARPDP